MAEPRLDNLLAPPTEGHGDLKAPAPVPVVAGEQAAGLVPVDEGVRAGLDARARGFVDELEAAGVRSPAFAAKLTDISTMGQADLRAGGRAAQRMLQRTAAAGASGTARVTASLGLLRRVVDDLDLTRAEGGGLRRLLRSGDPGPRYFARYEQAQGELDTILRELVAGQDELRRDNAAIDTDKAEARATMAKLSEYAALAAALDEAVTARVAARSAEGQADVAGVLRDDALTAVRQRRQDVLTHLAVATQGYLALDVVRRNNLELIRGVELARTGTLRVLRAAVAAASAGAQQQLVLDRIAGLDAAASTAAGTGDLDSLRAAWRELTATMDALDRYQADARTNLDASAAAVRRQAGGAP